MRLSTVFILAIATFHCEFARAEIPAFITARNLLFEGGVRRGCHGEDRGLTSLKEIEAAREKAKFLASKGQSYAAWEILEEARDQYYDDPLLQQQITSITAEVANFTVALTRAKEFENNDLNPQTGSSLAWYLEAKSIYPDSKFAQKGIDRLVRRIFSPKDSGPLDDEQPTSYDLKFDFLLFHMGLPLKEPKRNKKSSCLRHGLYRLRLEIKY